MLLLLLSKPTTRMASLSIMNSWNSKSQITRISVAVLLSLALFGLLPSTTEAAAAAAAAAAASKSIESEGAGCERVYFGARSEQRIACQCNATHCDSLSFDWPQDERTYLRMLSSKSGARFELSQLVVEGARTESQLMEEENKPSDYLIRIEVNRHRQQVLGFGGAFTDSASQVLGLLDEPVQKRALDDYFGPAGLDYNLGRVPIAGTDMSARPYSYDDLPPAAASTEDADLRRQDLYDLELRHFRLQPEDLIFKIPLIRRINRMRLEQAEEESRRSGGGGGGGSGGPLKLVAASWSAPAWMKSNRHLVQGRLLGNSSMRLFYDAYARYLARFLDEYERHNVTMWALSPQNEPHTPKRTGPATINFNSNNFEPDEMADFLEYSLIPVLLRAGRLAAARSPNRTDSTRQPDNQHNQHQVKLLFWDDTTDGLESYLEAALGGGGRASQAGRRRRRLNIGQHLAGLALHWYSQGLRETPYEAVREVRRALPSRYFMLSTEACFIGRPQPGNWERAERYARDIIENLRLGSVGWIDWNLALNESGGPSWSANLLDSCMLVDLSRQLYYKNPMFYAIGHLSRFIREGARILPSTLIDTKEQQPTAGQTRGAIHLVAAELERPARINATTTGNGGHRRAVRLRQVALVALNRGSISRRVQLELIECQAKAGQPPLELELPANSITSLAFVC